MPIREINISQTFRKTFTNKCGLIYPRSLRHINLKGVIYMSNNDQEFLVQKIRTQYTEKQHTELDALKALDAKAKKPANVFAYTYGSISAIIMGAGMSLAMTGIGAALGSIAMLLGIVIGVAGMALVALAYPIYNRTLQKERERITPEILRLSDELLQ